MMDEYARQQSDHLWQDTMRLLPTLSTLIYIYCVLLFPGRHYVRSFISYGKKVSIETLELIDAIDDLKGFRYIGIEFPPVKIINLGMKFKKSTPVFRI